MKSSFIENHTSIHVPFPKLMKSRVTAAVYLMETSFRGVVLIKGTAANSQDVGVSMGVIPENLYNFHGMITLES